MAHGPARPSRRLRPLLSINAAGAYASALGLVATLVLASGCRKTPGPEAPSAPAAAGAPAPNVDLAALTARVGVKPGVLAFKAVGPAASLMASQGTITIRRAGDDRFVDATENAPLFAGDVLWAGAHALATLALADDTVVQVAEETAVVIGDRALSADPASSLGVLYGVARVSVSPRSRGEGAFLVLAGPVVIGAKGTAFGVAVAAGGLVRVGVEHGEIDVAGPTALDTPASLETGQVVVVDAAGIVGKSEIFKADDWGDWRYAIETHPTLADAARVHANRLVNAEAHLDADYLALQQLGASASTLSWQAAAGVKTKATGEYKASAGPRATALEAVYRLAGEIARLTNSAQSDAFILAQLYARHPKELANDVAEFGQEIVGSILYGKKLVLVSETFLVPLRASYYANTARGRAHAASLGLPASAFSQVKLADPTAGELAKRLPGPHYVAPRIESTGHGHPVWQRAPKVGWDERLTLQPVPPRQGAWYVAPPQVDAHLVAGAAAVAAMPAMLGTPAPTEPENADLVFLVPPPPPTDAP
ncbi:MAG: hypothetical protein JWM82_90 [Myxococcales bacterium]|nr:hypothetical protein [Myxococcales bacterium]